jgi:methylenetetrahydrofolate dehydrogenase (NADP+) / methenyltetrahydrofolate cyclohydrolase
MEKIDCKALAVNINKQTLLELKKLDSSPKLVVINAGSDDSSKKYISLKLQKGLELGVQTQLIQFDSNVKIEEILLKVDELNKDDSVNGILIQLPVFEHLMPFKHRLLNSVNPIKDVDGLSAINFGLYSQDILNGILPATVDACLEVIKTTDTSVLNGGNVLIINNSDLIGKPLAMVLSTIGATVTIANEFTKNINDLIKTADIVISATGKGGLFNLSDLKDGALAIDVTSIIKEGKVIGDFKLGSESKKNIKFTPVPGGVGPLTISCLFRNLLNLTKLQNLER